MMPRLLHETWIQRTKIDSKFFYALGRKIDSILAHKNRLNLKIDLIFNLKFSYQGARRFFTACTIHHFLVMVR